MVKTMKPGSVIVDVAIDQGGCVETSKATTHSHPTYVVDGVVHYCVANMPGAVARTSTFALNNVTLPFAVALADKGWRKALGQDAHLRNGLNVCEGKITCAPVAEAHGLAFASLRWRSGCSAATPPGASRHPPRLRRGWSGGPGGSARGLPPRRGACQPVADRLAEALGRDRRHRDPRAPVASSARSMPNRFAAASARSPVGLRFERCRSRPCIAPEAEPGLARLAVRPRRAGARARGA